MTQSFGRARRPLHHAKLMAEDEDLEVLASVVSALLATADEETDEGADDEVEERPHRPKSARLSLRVLLLLAPGPIPPCPRPAPGHLQHSPSRLSHPVE